MEFVTWLSIQYSQALQSATCFFERAGAEASWRSDSRVDLMAEPESNVCGNTHGAAEDEIIDLERALEIKLRSVLIPQAMPEKENV